MTCRSDRRGFTLLELILVVFILGLTAGLAALAVGKRMESGAAKREAARMLRAARHARQLSLTYRVPYEISFDRGATSYQIDKPSKEIIETFTLPTGYTIGGESVVFEPKGTSTGGTIAIRDSNGEGYDVVIEKTNGSASVIRVQPH